MAPLLDVFGVNIGKPQETAASVEGLKAEFERIASFPDKFNRHFAEQGWVAYELLNLKTGWKAIETAQQEGIEAGETVLVDHYDEEQLHVLLLSMHSVEAFRPRMRLAEKAMEDYLAGRFHASVPVVLALLDGMVSDVNSRRGFFAESSSFEAWNSGTTAGRRRRGPGTTRLHVVTARRDISKPRRQPPRIEFEFSNRVCIARPSALLRPPQRHVSFSPSL